MAVGESLAKSLGWTSGAMLALMAGLALALLAFVLVERRAAAPILPLPLFRINTFLVVNGVGFLVGFAMFGTITFLPLFLQVVKGVSPTGSGLFLVPMMGGLIFASTMAGRISCWSTVTCFICHRGPDCRYVFTAPLSTMTRFIVS